MKKIFFSLLVLTTLFSLSSCNDAKKGSGDNPDKKVEGDGTVTMYITRHGKTIFNTMDRVQGWADSPLTPAGVEVAEDLGRGLQDTTFVAIYTSDSGRARETADLVMKFNKHKDGVCRGETTDLREWHFGAFEGDFNAAMGAAIMKVTGAKTKEEMFSQPIPAMADAIAASDTSKVAEDWKAIEKIATETAEKGGGNVLVVCHGLTISAITEVFDPSQAKAGLHNASVTKLVYKDGKYSITSFNDMEYVEQGKKLR